MSFINHKDGSYYEGDKIDMRDMDVPRRPDSNHAWDGANWTPAPAPIHTTVTMRQARRALLNAGLLGNVEAAIASMPGPDGDAARIDWGCATTVVRTDPLVVSLSVSLGLTESQLDALFQQAAAL